MSENTGTVRGTALARVLHRSLNLVKGNTETSRLRGGDGWSKRAKTVIAAFGQLLAAHDTLADRVVDADQDAITRFNELTRRVDTLAQTRVSNKGSARDDHRDAIEALTEEIERMTIDLDEMVEVSGSLPPPPPPPPPLALPTGADEDLTVELDGGALDRKGWLGLLSDIQQEIHQATSGYGGLKFCVQHVRDFPEDQQTAIMTYASRDRRRADLLKELGDAKDGPELAQVGRKIRGLHSIVGNETTTLIGQKQQESEDAVTASGLGDDAAQAMRGMVEDWRSIKITDAPNPYYGKKDEWEKSGLKDEALEHYNPANRYVHVDGDQFVNAAKSVAEPVARVQAEKQVPGLDDIRRDIETKDRDAITERVELRRNEFEDKVTTKLLDDWCRQSGSLMLTEAGQPTAADLWKRGDFDPEGLPEDLVASIQAAFNKHLEEYKKGDFESDVEKGIAQEVDKEIDNRATSRRNAQITSKVMAQGDYWAEVGRLAKKSDFGRCFSCAGVAVNSLVMDPAFDGQTIESVGAVTYDHHFVLVGRTGGEVGSETPPSLESNVLVVDIWQSNQGSDSPATNWKNFTYRKETKLKVFSVMAPSERKELRERCEQYARSS